jgi:mono/diheme cytochrome c family protein
MKSLLTALAAGFALVMAATPRAQDGATFAPERIKQGAAIYAQNCAPCHGPQMRDPDAAFDLRKFPPDQKGRFVQSVTKGKNAMPPWGDLFKEGEIDALWAYVMAGEKQ